MRQLLSSVFDAVVAVGVIVFVLAAALNRSTVVIVTAAVFVGLLTARIVIERSKVRAG